MFALNQGEVCTCPSRALVQSSIYDQFVADGVARTKAVRQGNPLDSDTMIGAQASNDQLEKILSYLEIGKAEGAKVLTGGERAEMDGDLAGGYYVTPTIFEGNNSMRIFQEEIFGPVLALTRFEDEADALKIANDTLYGLGAGVWSATAPRPTGPAGRSRPGASGPTATTPTRRTRPSAATSSRASAGRTTR
jgi:aldehyde dehydrogenase